MQSTIIRPISPADDASIAAIIRTNLKAFHLDLPGTAYYDPELDALSKFYNAQPGRRAYFIAADEGGTVLGGVGVAAFAAIDHCAEIQKLYLSDAAKGRGLSKLLMREAEDFARSAGYTTLYLETHTNLTAALGLYEKLGFRQIERPAAVLHSTMNRFYVKPL